MLETVITAKGKFATKTFIVNVRTPLISTGGEVKLKDREKATEQWAWDEKLTLEFNGARPAVDAIEIRTSRRTDGVSSWRFDGCDQPSEPMRVGADDHAIFGPGVAVANHAESGESLRSSLGAKRLDKVLSLMKPGDYLLIQYAPQRRKGKRRRRRSIYHYKASLKQFVERRKTKRRHSGADHSHAPANF